MDLLLTWALGKGARVHKLAPSPTNPRELVVSEDVTAGETLISIPQDLLLHAGSAFEDDEFGASFRQLANEQGLGLDLRPILCLYLILEKARQHDSRWSPYIGVLPDTYDDPFWWRDEQIRLLRGTRLGRAVAQYHAGLKQIASWAKRLEDLRRPGSPPSVLSSFRNGWALTEGAARWARSVVWSRSFTVRRLANGSHNVVAMVPVLDMIDHSPARDVVWHTGMDGTEQFQFVPLQAVPQGVVMTNNYGTKTSDELLLAYGFLLPHANPADYFQVSLAHRRQQHLPPQQQQQAAQLHGQPPGTPPVLNGVGPCAVGDDIDCGEPMVQQQLAEDLQRTLALSSLGLQLEHQLTLQQPLPPSLVHGAQLCLLHAPQLYMLTSQLLLRRLVRRAGAVSSADGSQADAVHVDRQACVRKRTGDLVGLSPRADAPKEGRPGAGNGGALGGGVQEQPQAGPAPSSTAAVLQGLLEAASAMRIRPSLPVPEGAVAITGVDSEAAGEVHSVPLPKELEALVSLHQQLDSKLACMISDEEEEAALSGSLQTAATPSGSSTTQSTAGKPLHSQLAVSYLRGQKAILRSSLAHLAERASQVVQAAAAAVSPDGRSTTAFSYMPLSPTPENLLCASEEGRASQGGPLPPIWASIDPDMHISQYHAWLRQHGLLPAATSVPYAEPAIEGAAAAGPGPGSARSKGQCLLQEVVCTRQANGNSGGAGVSGCSTDRLATTNGSGAAAGRSGGAAAGARAGARGPPSSSRTFRSLKPPVQIGAPDTSAQGGGQQQAMRLLKRVSMPQGIAATIGIDSDHDPTVLGVRVGSGVTAGSVVLEVPGECCFIATTRQQLVCALMASAHQLLDALLTAIAPHAAVALTRGIETATATATAAISGAQVPLTFPVDMFAWHLLHSVGSSPANRLHVSDVDGVQLLLDMLEDSPAGSAYQEAYEALKHDYQALRVAVFGNPSGKAAVGQNGKETDMFWRMLSWPSSFNLYCWADHVVSRCAVRVTGAAAAAAHRPGALSAAATPPGRSMPRTKPSAAALAAQQQEAWVLVPVVAAAPPELRNAVLDVRLQMADVQEGTGVPRGPLPYLRVRNNAPLSVVVTATCALPAGLHLTPLLLLPALDCEEVMAVHGPEGLVWRRLLLQQEDGSASNTCVRANASSSTGWEAAVRTSSRAGAGTGGSAAAAAVSATTAAAAGVSNPQLSAHLLYELYICPSEEDMLCEEKLQLLAASGLGCVHFLTEGLTTEPMVGAALKICLAGPEVLEHPLALQCIQLHSALLSSGSGDVLDTVGVGLPAPPAASTTTVEGAAGGSRGGGAPGQGQITVAGGAGGHAPPPDLPQQLCAAQTELVAMLAALPDDHPVSRAARKQLRQMVHDARKNTRRRLRQLEAVHAHAAAHPSAKAPIAPSPFGGSYSPLGGSSAMHEGVRLYLQALCAVLDDCAERLGLNRQSDSLRNEKKASK